MHIYTLDQFVRKKTVIRNPVAGSDSKKAERILRKRIGTDEFNYYETKKKGDAAILLSELIAEAEKENKIAMALLIGGDGFYQDAVNAKGDLSRVILALIKGGTSSDLSRSLNLNNTAETGDIINKIFEGKKDINDYIKPMDLINVNYDGGKEVKAMNMFSLGFDGLLCKEVNTSRKKGGFGVKNIYVKKMYEIMKEKRYEPIQIGFSLNNETSETLASDILMFTIINGRYAGGGMNYNPYFSINDGALEGFLVKNIGKKEIGKLIWHVLAKKDEEHITSKKDKNGFNRFNINYMQGIELARINLRHVNDGCEYYFNVDGEHHIIENPRLPLEVKVLPKATNVLYLPD